MLPPNKNLVRQLGYFSVIIADLVGYTGAGVGLGYFCWHQWHAPWWVLLFFSTAGLGLAMYKLYLLSKKDGGF
ncbi:hypothetical protein WDW86_14565 [Bdellovibrionota bacterium FG-2]